MVDSQEWHIDSRHYAQTGAGTWSGLAVAYGCDDVPDEGARVAEANARLIAEAGTVLHETGLTPRQLAEQRAELLEALQRLEKAGENMRNTVVESRGLRYMDAHDFALRDSRELIERIANATQQRNATGGEG